MSEVAPRRRITEPGIYSLSGPEYHADPVVVPSLSRSIALLLCDLSPAHAYAAHPRLGPGLDDDPDEVVIAPDAREDRDAGSAAHSIFLRGENIIDLVPFNTYNTKAARELRDHALAAGRIPLKQSKYDDVMRLVEVLEKFRATTGFFTKGKPEQTLVWKVGDVWCRAMVDWLPDDPSEPLLDLKTTGGRARSSAWTRSCFDKGYDLQSVLYCEGAAELRDGVVPSMQFIVAETKLPHGIRRFELSPPALEVGAERVNYARNLWERCTAANDWPTYPIEPEWIDAPIYVLREWDWRKQQQTWEQRNAIREASTQRIIDAKQYGG
jgi:hypothetical protein